MSRYIDADKFIEWLDVGHLRSPSEICYCEGDVKVMIDMQPTADVVEVVRCKDCKYYTAHYYGSYGDYGRCDHPQQEYDIECFDMWVSTNPDDFCSYGERREDK